MKTILRTILPAVILFFITGVVYAKPNAIITSTRGELNLSDYNFEEQGSIKLKGEWEFYWKKFYLPSDFKTGKVQETPIWAKVPSSWAKYKLNEKKLSSLGYGTYRINIRVPDGVRNYMFRINDIFTSYHLYINGRDYGETGKVDMNSDYASPYFHSNEYLIELSDDIHNVEIIIQVANFSHKKAGIVYAPTFGSPKSVMTDIKREFSLNLLIIGIIIIIAFNHLIQFFYRRRDKANLFFGLLCLVMILRSISTNDRILTFWFPNFDWSVLMRIDNFSGFGTIPIFAAFLYTQYRSDFPRVMASILIALGGIISVIIFVTPILFFNKLSTFFELYVLLGGLYLSFGVLFRAVLRKRTGAWISFLGFFLLTATAINDVLINMSLIHSAYMASFGLVCFMVLESYLISSNAAKALTENEKLSHELNNEKLNLESRIAERTAELEGQNAEINKLREIELENSWFNQSNAELNEIIAREKDNAQKLSSEVLSLLVKRVDANIGAIYMYNEEKGQPTLDLIGNYGYGGNGREQILPGEGLAGTCFTSKNQIHLKDIPDSYVKISSGLGSSKASEVIIVPLVSDEKCYGVMEIATVNTLTKRQFELVSKISENIASAIHRIIVNNKTTSLLEQFKQKEEELQNREIQLRESLDELEALREVVRKK